MGVKGLAIPKRALALAARGRSENNCRTFLTATPSQLLAPDESDGSNGAAVSVEDGQ
jgi:hypothetical protein